MTTKAKNYDVNPRIFSESFDVSSARRYEEVKAGVNTTF
jgi:hypothetical protein